MEEERETVSADLARKRENVQGWLTVCALSRWFAAGLMGYVCIRSLLVPPVGRDAVQSIRSLFITQARVASLMQQWKARQAVIPLVAVAVLICVLSTLPFFRKRSAAMDALLQTEEWQSMCCTTILGALAVAVLWIGGQLLPFGSSQVGDALGQATALAGYLSRTFWILGAGYVLTILAVLTQPFMHELPRWAGVLLAAGEVCLAVLCLRPGREALLVAVGLLHLLCADIVLSVQLSRREDALPDAG